MESNYGFRFSGHDIYGVCITSVQTILEKLHYDKDNMNVSPTPNEKFSMELRAELVTD
jgi:hypothetical protein